MIVTRFACLSILLVFLFISPAARAKEPTARAKALFVEGTKQYDVGRYREALVAFQDAYLAKPEPGILINIGQCHRMLGNHEQAIRQFHRFLDSAPPDHQMRPEIEAIVASEEAALKHERESLPPTGPASASATPSEKPTDLRPLDLPTTDNASTEKTPAEKPTLPSPTALARQPESRPTTVALLPAPLATAPTTPTEASTPVYKEWWFWTALVGGAAAIGVGVGLGVALSSPAQAPFSNPHSPTLALSF